MSDTSVHAALRSPAPLVVIEAPAGCGKTFKGADYAKDLAAGTEPGRPLILTHTHAARSVFAARTMASTRVDIRTIDSVVVQIASAYRESLGLAEDPAVWARQRENGYGELAGFVARLLERHPMVARALAVRHPVIICDEHQDSSAHQHALISAALNQGARVRIFADPVQKIFREDESEHGAAADWDSLKDAADQTDELDYPHRWDHGCRDLGRWLLLARQSLKTGARVDLREGHGRPASVQVVPADNVAQAHDQFRVLEPDRKKIDAYVDAHGSLLVLTRTNDLARAIRAFFNREIPLWEGHKRDALDVLVRAVTLHEGDPAALARDVVTFIGEVAVGFSASSFGNLLQQESSEGCVARRRPATKPALVQKLARCLVEDPSHRGVSQLLRQLADFRKDEWSFGDVKLDRHREFWEAAQLGRFDTAEGGLAEITHRRTYAPSKLPDKAISNIHKAKGLECHHAVIMPCTRSTFPDTELARRLLYVAMSRASHKLMIVVSRTSPSPLFVL